MRKLPSLKPKQVLKALLRAGFYIYHQKGSHICKQAELSREEFLDLL